MKRLLFGAFALLLSVSFSPRSFSASFNCKTNNHPNEQLICRSAELSQLDERMSELYQTAMNYLLSPNQQEQKQYQRQWLRDRINCGADFTCTKRAYTERIEQLRVVLGAPTNRGLTQSPQAATQPPPTPTPQRAGTSWGTGFFVSPEGHIVTNAHVVERCRYVSASRGGKIAQVAHDEASDLAIYISSQKPIYWASLRGGKGPRAGESVLAAGFPLTGLLSSDPIVTTGIISALAGIRNDRRIIQITAPVQPGNSGGPLLGETGSVVGVVVGKLDALKVAEIIGDIPQNINFAVSLGTLQSFLNAHGIPYVLDEKNITKSYTDIAAEASRYIVLLECAR